jgi:regulator of sirC expression with transglutaminase-like and TPR domain
VTAPRYCRPEVWERFTTQVPLLHHTQGLVEAASVVAWQIEPAIKIDDVAFQLDALAALCSRGLHSYSPTAAVAHMHRELFEELGYTGNTADYYSPHNSLLPVVLEKRQGLPVILCLIYKAVAERMGLVVEGINTPGHFLAAVRTEDDWMIIDPFQAGRMLTIAEVGQLIEDVTSQPLKLTWEEMPIADHPLWLARIILNLIGIYERTGERQKSAAMKEMLQYLTEHALKPL